MKPDTEEHNEPAAKRIADATQYVEPARLPLSVMNSAFLDAQKFNAAARAERRALFDFIEARCPDERYRELQEKYLNDRALQCLADRPEIDMELGVLPEKYLHLPHWTNSKLGVAKMLGLHKSPPLDILDIGSGSGHFGLVCAHFGHRYEGLDIEAPPLTPFSRGDIFSDLFACFGLTRMTQRIEAYTPLQTSRRFDCVTGLMTKFNNASLDTPAWQWPEWQYFLQDLVNHVLKPDYRIFMQLNRNGVSDELMAAFEGHGATTDHQRCHVSFDSATRERLWQD